MTAISFKFDDDNKFPEKSLLPEGPYLGQIIEVKQMENAFDGEFTAIIWELEDLSIKRDKLRLWHIEDNKRKAAQIKTKKLCNALNIKLKMESDGTASFDPSEWKGKRAYLIIKHIRTKDGKIIEAIDDYKPYNEKEKLSAFPF
jgi:hypothetical protein